MSAVRLVLLGTTAPLAYAALEQVFSIAKGILWPGERGLRCALDSDGYRAEVSCVALHDAGEPSFAARVREADAVLFVADASEHRGARLARLAAEVQRHRAGVEARLHAGACVDQGPERSLRDVLVTAALLPAAWLDGLPKAQAVEGGHEVHETARALVGAVLRARRAAGSLRRPVVAPHVRGRPAAVAHGERPRVRAGARRRRRGRARRVLEGQDRALRAAL